MLLFVPLLLRGPFTDLRQTWWESNNAWRGVDLSQSKRLNFTFNFSVVYVIRCYFYLNYIFMSFFDERLQIETVKTVIDDDDGCM